MLTTIILVILILALFGGGLGYSGGAYRTQGFSIGGILLVILVVMLLTGRL